MIVGLFTVKVFAVRLQINDYSPGYHSLWRDEGDAEKIVQIHSGSPSMKYWKEEVEGVPCQSYSQREYLVKVPGAMGAMSVQSSLRK